MNDTSPEMEEKMRELIRQKTPGERAIMGLSMHDASKYLVTQAILRENPAISPIRLKQELFLRFYKNDFSPEEKDRILRYFETHPKSR